MTLEGTKQLTRQIINLLNNGDTVALKQSLSDNFTSHFAGRTMTKDQFLQFNQMVKNAFPDFTFSIEDLIAEGDSVVARLTATGTHKGAFQGFQPTNKQFKTTGFSMFKISNGKVIEQWANPDQLGMFQQLGFLPTKN